MIVEMKQFFVRIVGNRKLKLTKYLNVEFIMIHLRLSCVVDGVQWELRIEEIRQKSGTMV